MILLKGLILLASIVLLAACDALARAADTSNPHHGLTPNSNSQQKPASDNHLNAPVNDGRQESPFVKNLHENPPPKLGIHRAVPLKDAPLHAGHPGNPPVQHSMHDYAERDVSQLAARDPASVDRDVKKHPTERSQEPPPKPGIHRAVPLKDAPLYAGHPGNPPVQHSMHDYSERDIPHLAARDPNFRSFIRGIVAVAQGSKEQHTTQVESANVQPNDQTSAEPPPVPPKPVIPPSKQQQFIIHHLDETPNKQNLVQFSGTSKPLPLPQTPPNIGNPPLYQKHPSNSRRRSIDEMLTGPPPHLGAPRNLRRWSTTMTGNDGASSAGASVAGAPGRDSSSRGATMINQFRMSSNPSGKSTTLNRMASSSDDGANAPDPYKERYLNLLREMKAMQHRQQQNQNHRHHTQNQYNPFQSQSDEVPSGYGASSRYGSMKIPSEPHEMNHFTSPQHSER